MTNTNTPVIYTDNLVFRFQVDSDKLKHIKDIFVVYDHFEEEYFVSGKYIAKDVSSVYDTTDFNFYCKKATELSRYILFLSGDHPIHLATYNFKGIFEKSRPLTYGWLKDLSMSYKNLLTDYTLTTNDECGIYYKLKMLRNVRY